MQVHCMTHTKTSKYIPSAFVHDKTLLLRLSLILHNTMTNQVGGTVNVLEIIQGTERIGDYFIYLLDFIYFLFNWVMNG